MPAAELLGPDCGAYPDAVAETYAGAHAITDARTFPKPDDGDARADASSLRKSDARTVLATNNRSALKQAHPSALLV